MVLKDTYISKLLGNFKPYSIVCYYLEFFYVLSFLKTFFAGLFSGVHFNDPGSSAGWPDFFSISGKNGNMQEQNISYGHPNCPDNMQKRMADSVSNDHSNCATDGGHNAIANALTQIFTEAGKRNDQVIYPVSKCIKNPCNICLMLDWIAKLVTTIYEGFELLS